MVSPETFVRLGALLASPNDTFDALISRLLDADDKRGSVALGSFALWPFALGPEHLSKRQRLHAERPLAIDAEGIAVFSPAEGIDLSHTILHGATLDGDPVECGGRLGRPTWNGLVAALVRRVLIDHDRASPEFLNRMRFTAFETETATRPGHIWFPDIGLALRQFDAAGAWRSAMALAEGEVLTVDFEWKRQPGAAHPGQKARLSSGVVE